MNINANYLLDKEVERIEAEDSLILLQENQGSAFVLDSIAKELLEYFDGEHSVTQISNCLAQKYGDTYKEEEFFFFVKELIQKNILLEK